jgi:lysophospholipase L1-like esterase
VGAVAATAALGLLAWRTGTQVRRLREAGTRVARLDQDAVMPGRPPAYRLVVLGDSAAAGHGLPSVDAGLARQVGRRLAARSGRAVDVRNLAVDGTTTRDVLAEQFGELEASSDVVLIGVGVNDAVRGRTPRAVREVTTALLTAIRGRAPDAEVVLLTCPDLGSAPGLPGVLRPLLGRSCRRVARAQAEVASRLGVAVVPADGHLPAAAFGPDGFHPGPIGVAILADRVDVAITRHTAEPQRRGEPGATEQVRGDGGG